LPELRKPDLDIAHPQDDEVVRGGILLCSGSPRFSLATTGVLQMIDSATEQLLFLRDVPERIPPRKNGQRIHISCIYRWCGRGVRGVRLETIDLGGAGKATSVEALQRFFVALSRAPGSHAACRQRPPRQRHRAIAAAEKKFAAAV
jgi:uncharacterized protein DUF1580